MSEINNDEGGSGVHGSKKCQTKNVPTLQDFVVFTKSEVANMGNLDLITIVPPSSLMKEDLEIQNEELKVINDIHYQVLDKLHQKHQEALMVLEGHKIDDLRQHPDSEVVETTEYICLQTHYSELYNALMFMRRQLIEATELLEHTKNDNLCQMEGMEESMCGEQKKLAGEESLRKIKELKEQYVQLQEQCYYAKRYKQLVTSKLEKDYDNWCSLQIQSHKRDDIHLKLTTKRLNDNELKNLTREETDNLKEQINALTHQVEMKDSEIRQLKEKKRILQLRTVDKECSVSQLALEMNEQEAIEYDQSAADLKLHLDKNPAQMKEA